MQVGGVAHVSATYMGQTATATLTVKLLLQQNPGDYALSMGHFLDLNAQALGRIARGAKNPVVLVTHGPPRQSGKSNVNFSLPRRAPGRGSAPTSITRPMQHRMTPSATGKNPGCIWRSDPTP